MKEINEQFFNLDEFVPSLRQAVVQPPFDPTKLVIAAVAIKEPGGQGTPVPAGNDRRVILLTSGKNHWLWKVDSLQGLFRGDKQPPVFGDYPDEEYTACFALLESHAMEISKFFGNRTDEEMKEIYSNLRRRPDGRSLGFVHDYMWQGAAFLLGSRILSQPEFEAILARLERSCRRFAQGHVSRNYIETLRMTFGR